MKVKELKTAVSIPAGIDVSIEGQKILVRGPKGYLEKSLPPKLKAEKQKAVLELVAKNATKKEKKLLNTFTAHIKNIIKGINEGYVYKLKICSGHFPMHVSIEKDRFIIKNFLGEKVPRKAKIFSDVQLEIKNDIVIVSGANKESVGQTAANIEKATRIVNRDLRVFQDGIYIIKKEKPV